MTVAVESNGTTLPRSMSDGSKSTIPSAVTSKTTLNGPGDHSDARMPSITAVSIGSSTVNVVPRPSRVCTFTDPA